MIDTSSIGWGTIYDAASSSTYSATAGQTYGLYYADGSHSAGTGATDTIAIGSATVTSMPFGYCTDLALGSGQTSRDTDGALGFGFGAENSMSPRGPTFMEQLISENPDIDPVFSTAFSTSGGTVDFGFSDSTAYTGQLTTVSIQNSSTDTSDETTAGTWATTGVTFGVGGTAFANIDPTTLAFDSGTSSLSVQQAVADAYFAGVTGATKLSDGSGNYQYPCSSTLPDLQFFFSSESGVSGPSPVTVPGSFIADGNNPTSGTCDTQINVVTGRSNAGTPFYTSQYMIWNQAVPSLSFAAQA